MKSNALVEPPSKDKSLMREAAQKGNVDLLKELLEKYGVNAHDVRAEPDGTVYEYWTVLHDAARSDCSEAIEVIVAAGGDPDSEYVVKTSDGSIVEGNTALHVAAKVGCLNAIEALVAAKANLEAKYTEKTKYDQEKQVFTKVSEGMTPLHAAAMSDNPDAIKVLVAKGADHTAKYTINMAYDADKKAYGLMVEGLAPLHAAAVSNSRKAIEVIEALVAAGVDLEAKYTMKKPNDEILEGLTPLHAAVIKDSPEAIKALVTAGADPKVKHILKNPDGTISASDLTLLHSAASKGCVKALETLVEAGLDLEAKYTIKKPNGKILEGLTPLHSAVMGNSPEAIQALIKVGANQRVKHILKNPDGTISASDLTLLHLAASKGCVKASKALVEMGGIDLHAKDSNGDTAISYAIKAGNAYAAASLVNLGSEVTPELQSEMNDKIIGLINKGFKTARDWDAVQCWKLAGAIASIETPLHLAAHACDVAAIKELSETSNVNAQCTYVTSGMVYQGITPLHLAIKSGKQEIESKSKAITALLEAGADYTAKYTQTMEGGLKLVGLTVMHAASFWVSPEIITAFAKVKADPNAQCTMVRADGTSIEGKTPLHILAAADHPQAIEALKALVKVEGIDLNAEDSLGNTAISFVIKVGNAKAAACLVEAGSEVTPELQSKMNDKIKSVIGEGVNSDQKREAVKDWKRAGAIITNDFLSGLSNETKEILRQIDNDIQKEKDPQLSCL